MAAKDSGGPWTAQDIEWLTPTPGGASIELPWPDADGPFLLTCHLAQVNGRTLLVGLDVRSFTERANGDIVVGAAGLTEVNHPSLRSLRAGEIAEAARAKLAAALASEAQSRRLPAVARERARRHHGLLIAPSLPSPTGPRPASSQLQKVADLYLHAVGQGGDQARRPAIYVHRDLAASGQDINLNAVRGQIHRARVKGLIPPTD